jgi:N6-adenosine-specific RNA methylase IME4
VAKARTIEELAAMRPFGGYRSFLADPAWRPEMRSPAGEKKAPQAKYRCMTPDEIAAMPIELISARDAVLFLWTTAPNLAQAFAVIPRWGFVYKSAAAWAKESKNSGALDTDDGAHKFAFGNGYIFRSAAEFLLVATRGAPTWNDTKAARSVRNLIYAPVREHSRKPDSQYEIVETLTIGPFIELFSRTPRDGWDAFGDQAEQFAPV